MGSGFLQNLYPPKNTQSHTEDYYIFFPMPILPKGKIWDILQLYEIV